MSEWGPQNFPTSLVELHLYGHNSGVGSFAVEEDVRSITTLSFLLPPSLVSLRLLDFMDVESLLEKKGEAFMSGVELKDNQCGRVVESFPFFMPTDF
ncbi:hypothetical protein L1887_18266 [Cichorium endivia]|nr:hypothetical protein L1887_18266 [Cichorium endivia]